MRITAFQSLMRIKPGATPKFSGGDSPPPDPFASPFQDMTARGAARKLTAFVAGELPSATPPQPVLPNQTPHRTTTPRPDTVMSFITSRLPTFTVPTPAEPIPVKPTSATDVKALQEKVKALLGDPIQNWVVSTNDSMDGCGEELGVYYGHPEDIAAHFHSASIYGLTLSRATDQHTMAFPIPPSDPPQGSWVTVHFAPRENVQDSRELLSFQLPREGLAEAVRAWLDTEEADTRSKSIAMYNGDSAIKITF
jgi:hypothetical protein